MTTIATDGKTMAADGLATTEDGMIAARETDKLFSVGEDILGFSGAHVDCLLFHHWLREGGDANEELEKPKLTGEFAAMLLTGTGDLLVYDDCLTPTPVEPPFAIGSGAKYAIAAMDMGASPPRAVEIASERDIRTGGLIIESLPAQGMAARSGETAGLDGNRESPVAESHAPTPSQQGSST